MGFVNSLRTPVKESAQSAEALAKREMALKAREDALQLGEQTLTERMRSFDAEVQRRRERIATRERELNILHEEV